jgi:hypothetical protein
MVRIQLKPFAQVEGFSGRQDQMNSNRMFELAQALAAAKPAGRACGAKGSP